MNVCRQCENESARELMFLYYCCLSSLNCCIQFYYFVCRFDFHYGLLGWLDTLHGTNGEYDSYAQKIHRERAERFKQMKIASASPTAPSTDEESSQQQQDGKRASGSNGVRKEL